MEEKNPTPTPTQLTMGEGVMGACIFLVLWVLFTVAV